MGFVVRCIFILCTFLICGCGELSNVINITFRKDVDEAPVKSASALGMSPAAGTKRSGSFRLDAEVGSSLNPLIQKSGSFILYVGIQGQVVSK